MVHVTGRKYVYMIFEVRDDETTAGVDVGSDAMKLPVAEVGGDLRVEGPTTRSIQFKERK